MSKSKNCGEVVKGNTNLDLPKKPKNNDVDRKAKGWCFTSFEEEKPSFIAEKFQYLCFSPEVCPETGKKHWQGYFYLKNDMTLRAIKKKIADKWHFTKASGTAKENFTYCGGADYSKDGKVKCKNELFEEFGTIPQQGKRNDLDALADEIKKGKLVDDIVLENPTAYHQYGRTLEKIQSVVNSRKFRMLEEMPDVTWYHGGTGVGKSHKAFENYNPLDTYTLNVEDNGFWEGYNGQKRIIINEFRGQMPFAALLQLCDKWPYDVKKKGCATVPCMADTIIITSCKTPQNIYKHSLDDEENINQFTRRCKIIELTRQN